MDPGRRGQGFGAIQGAGPAVMSLRPVLPDGSAQRAQGLPPIAKKDPQACGTSLAVFTLGLGSRDPTVQLLADRPLVSGRPRPSFTMFSPARRLKRPPMCCARRGAAPAISHRGNKEASLP